MPLPTPNKGESKEDFMDRCLSSEVMNKEYPDNKQRLAVCNSQWERKDEASLGQQFSEMSKREKSLEDFEYLLHHIEIDGAGNEVIHHCYILDHIANLFEQQHLVVRKGMAYVDGKKIEEGIFHTIKGLEPTQQIAWSDEEGEEKGIKPKKMKTGMTYKDKAKIWG